MGINPLKLIPGWSGGQIFACRSEVVGVIDYAIALTVFKTLKHFACKSSCKCMILKRNYGMLL